MAQTTRLASFGPVFVAIAHPNPFPAVPAIAAAVSVNPWWLRVAVVVVRHVVVSSLGVKHERKLRNRGRSRLSHVPSREMPENPFYPGIRTNPINRIRNNDSDSVPPDGVEFCSCSSC
jgi:hypothetical protein